MAREIPAELREFKNALDGKLDGMKSAASEISSSIQKVTTAANTAKSEVSAAYKPADGNNTAASKLGTLSSLGESIATEVSSTISAACASAQSIIGKVTEMESLIADMEAQQGKISTEKAKEKPNSSVISSAQAKLTEDENKFDQDETDAKAQLAALKGMDKSVDTSESSTAAPDTAKVETKLAEYTKYLNQLKYGTFTEESFVASNGIKIDYFLYKPDYGQEVKGLPVFMYMHGIGFENKGKNIVTYGGLGEALQNKTVTPSGIVVLPHVKNGRLYEDAEYRKALAELPVQVCKDNDGDTDRISIGGTSYGAVTAFRLVNENPGTFSAVVNACGAEAVSDAFKDVKVWNFNGRNEANNHTGRKYVGKQTEAVKQAGGSGQYTLFDNVWAHTNIGTMAFQNMQLDESTGEYIYPFEWAFKQSKKEKAKSSA